MKKILFALLFLLPMTACNQNKAAKADENQKASEETLTDAVSSQTSQNTIKEVHEYLKKCGTFFVATTDGDRPYVRPFGVSEIINGRLYIMTGKVKDVYKQIAKNGRVEICALLPSGSEWMRLSGTLVTDETPAAKKEFLERNPSLKSTYKADDDNMAILYMTNATARFCSFSEAERRATF